MFHRPIPFLTVGAISALLAVLLGAFAAHVLRTRLDAVAFAAFQTGVQYQMYHALALVLIALLQRQLPLRAPLRAAGICFLGGIVLFSGSLYLLALTELKGFGMLTPPGGLLFVGGWLCVAIAGVRND